jgi:hypothetical protein
MKTIVFIKSPTGSLNLGYHIGDEARVSNELADKAIGLGLAKEIKEAKEKPKRTRKTKKDSE